MNHVNQCILARLECYRDYSQWTIKPYKYKNPSGLNVKAVGDSIRIKLKRDLFIHIEGSNVYLTDTIVPTLDGKYTRVPKSLVVGFKDVTSGIGWIKKFIENPSLPLKMVVSRMDPVVVCKMYLPNEDGSKKYIRVGGKHATGINASQIEEFKKEGVVFETGAKEDIPLQMRIGAKKKVHSFNNSKANNAHTNLTQKFKRG